jgi:hypothetical protein
MDPLIVEEERSPRMGERSTEQKKMQICRYALISARAEMVTAATQSAARSRRGSREVD